MVFTESPKRIVITYHKDDGTTLGKKVYVDDIGGKWVKASEINVQLTGYCGRTINEKGEFVFSTTI